MPKTILQLHITADHNDADYTSSVTEVTQEQLNRLMPVIQAVKKFKSYKGESKAHAGMRSMTWIHSHNWPDGEYAPRTDLGEKTIQELYGDKCDADALEEFRDMVPIEDGNVHTIKRILLVEVVKQERLL